MSNLVFNASLVGDWFYNLWISLWLLIDNIVYVCINWMYRVFILVSKVDIFGGGGQIEEIVERLYLIVGIAMLFIFAYNLILLIINPEGNQLGNMGKVIQNALISIVLVTLLPLIFSYMSTIQSHIIDSNVIGHIILGTSNDPDADPDNKKAGVDTALTIFSAFYHPKDETLYSCKKGGTAAMCSKYISVYDTAYNNDDITGFIWDDDLKDGLKNDEMEYTYFLSSAAGIFALWMFISFGLDIGIRVGKLAFYQLISPIPVMMRILPGDKMFGKWFSGLKDTYISLFVRLAVIYFCMYAITLVPDVLSGMWATSGDNVIILALANVLVILGILKFAQEAPKLIGDLFGGSGNLSFGIAKKVTDNKLAMGGLGMMRGGFGSASRNMFKSWRESGDAGDKWYKRIGKTALSTTGGLFGGAKRGASAGYGSSSFKDFRHKSDASIEETTEKRKERASYRALHPGFLGSTRGHIKDAVVAQGIWTGADADRDIIDKVKYEDKVIKSADGYKELYNNPKYQRMDADLNELESKFSRIEKHYDRHGNLTGEAAKLKKEIDNLKIAMRAKKAEAVGSKQSAAAYSVYEMSQALNSDPGMLAKLAQFGLEDSQIEMLKSLHIKGNDVYYKDASGEHVLQGDVLTKLLVGGTVDASGNFVDSGHASLDGAISDAKKHYSDDKGSVVYKNQMRIEEERKNKNG